MYIKAVKFHFSNGDSFEVKGGEAQRIYDYEFENSSPYIEVRFDGFRRLVARNSILFVDVEENKEANQLMDKMKQLYNTICTLEDIPWDNEWEWEYWFIHNNSLCVGDEEDHEVLSDDPQVVALAAELFEMQRELDKLVGTL